MLSIREESPAGQAITGAARGRPPPPSNGTGCFTAVNKTYSPCDQQQETQPFGAMFREQFAIFFTPDVFP